MIQNFLVYVNGHSYDLLMNSSYYGDRPEFYRQHEKQLWTLFQIVKNNNEVTITNEAKQIIQKIQNIEQLKSWIAKTYPDFLNQIEQKIYTKFPHPNDILE
jgi:hypothetical protein